MTHDAEKLFFALLAIALAVLVVAIWLSVLFDRSGRFGLIALVRPVALELAALVAVVCLCGSLYLQFVLHFVPCPLCWIQRGFMYPAAVVLVAAVVTRWRALAFTGLGLAVLGLPVSIYHRIDEEMGGSLNKACSSTCAIKWINEFGFITIPTMAGVGFIGIITLVALHLSGRGHGEDTDTAEDDEELATEKVR